jgi:hypothetical protein
MLLKNKTWKKRAEYIKDAPGFPHEDPGAFLFSKLRCVSTTFFSRRTGAIGLWSRSFLSTDKERPVFPKKSHLYYYNLLNNRYCCIIICLNTLLDRRRIR